MQIRDLVLGLARPPRLGDRRTLADRDARLHQERAEMRERRLVAVCRRDRHRQAVRRHLAGERHLAGGRRAHALLSLDRDVDPAMLAGGVRIVADRESA
jgi:hypothetical protein